MAEDFEVSAQAEKYRLTKDGALSFNLIKTKIMFYKKENDYGIKKF